MIRELMIRELTARYRGRARDLAYLEFAQEHFLHWMQTNGLFEECVFKGGTALRKFVFGLQGRFSTDLDFSAEDETTGEVVLLALRDGIEHEGVRFSVLSDSEDADGRHIRWRATTAEFGDTIIAKMDFTTYAMLMPAVILARAALPGVDARMGFEPTTPPLMDVRENASEKLARLRRLIVARDLYDLALLAPRLRPDLGLLLDLLCVKVYFDVVETQRGNGPFRGGAEFVGLRDRALPGADDVGELTSAVPNMRDLATTVENTYAAMGEPQSRRQRRLARCEVAYNERQWALAEADRFRSEHAE